MEAEVKTEVVAPNRITKVFVPPVERPAMDHKKIGKICDYIGAANDKVYFKQSKIRAAKMQAVVDSMSIASAKQIGCDDILIRLQRNALAYANVIGILQMVAENLQTNIRDILTACNAEHEQYLDNVEKLRKQWYKQERANQQKERRNGKEE